ncbi:ACT domain-containing protein [Marinobacterium rhizophilum]|uniref:ACT domain-containing protein n=1 Tax=Marinobacterium rhizophilum TaxID=420402 RepID=UPI00035E01D1|nr:ACT domain-containing protein [Marinobacterium rhizophilum]
MHTIWLITLAGPDCPDMLHKFSETIALGEGVILDRQLAILEGRVSGLMKLQLHESCAHWVWQRLQSFSAQGLHIVTRQVIEDPAPVGQQLSLAIRGNFRLGLDHEIRQILESHGALIEQYNQHFIGAPLLGEQGFHARIRARLTRRLSPDNLTQALNRLAQGLEFDINTEHLYRA